MSNSSRLRRPASAERKSPSLRKEVLANRSCMLRIGERLMRAGSEGNLAQRPVLVQDQSQACSSDFGPRPNGQSQLAISSAYAGNHSSKDMEIALSTVSATVVDGNTEHHLQKRQHTVSSSPWNSYSSSPHSSSTLPGHCTGASSRDHKSDILRGQHYEAERKEVFLEQLRHKYHLHTTTIMDHQEHMREQTRSLQLPESPHCTGVLSLEPQGSVAALTMSKLEGPHTEGPFTRGCKARASLPVGRSSSHSNERSRGVLYLQYGEETKQVYMSSEIMSQDTLRAMFISAFPQQLTMKMLQSPNMAIYIKDTSRNGYYDLEDIRNIAPHSCLKVYHKDPAYVFSRHTGPTNTEGRISKEGLHGSHRPLHTLSSSSRSPLHNLQGSISPPMVRSMPSSPSRMASGVRDAYGRARVVDPGGATLPRESLSGRSSTLSNSSSSILERRDVKPDEDVGSNKSMTLVVHGEGPHYEDSYSSLNWDEVAHLSIASCQCSTPSSLSADPADGGFPEIPGVLQYRASVKPLMGYGEQTWSPHRQKSRNYEDGQHPRLGSKTPAISMAEVQMIRGVGPASPERMSQIHQPLWQKTSGATNEMRNRRRGCGSSLSVSSVFMDNPLAQPETLFQGPVTTVNQSERMQAMEEQIASLTGLVHHALSMGVDSAELKDTASENGGHKVTNNTSVPCKAQKSAAIINSCCSAPMAVAAPTCDNRLQHKLTSAKRSVSDLQEQLYKLRQLQISNQEAVNSMLRVAGQELLVVLCEHLAQSKEVVYRQRTEMEKEKMQYLATEDKILTQLSKLEEYLAHLQTSDSSVTLRDVEEGAVSLRNVGETLAILKSEFPELQVKMCSVLKVEVEAMRFLKDEPQKMDSMLKRVKALTEDLSALRRCMSESFPPARPVHVELLKIQETDKDLLKTQSPSSPKPLPRSSFRPPLATTTAELGFVGSAYPTKAHRMKTTTATVTQAPHHNPLLTTIHGRDSVTVVKATGRQPPEGTPSLGPNAVIQPSSNSDCSHTPAPNNIITECCDKALHETQPDPTAPKAEQDTPRNLTLQAPAEQQTAVSITEDHGVRTQIDEVDSHQIKPSDTATALSSSSLSSSSASSAGGSKEQSSRPQIDKPCHSIVYKDLKQSQERASKSPPPPPAPRRFHAATSGLTTGRSEKVFSSRKDPLGLQDKHVKELLVSPQPKPLRQSPEVKDKAQNTACVLTPPSPSPPPASTDRGQDEEENNEDTKVMKEIQVTVDTSHESLFIGKTKGVGSTSTNQNHSEPLTSVHKSVPMEENCSGKSTTDKYKDPGDAREDTLHPDSNEVVILKMGEPAPAVQDVHIFNEGNQALNPTIKPTDKFVSAPQNVKAPPVSAVSPNQMKDVSSTILVDTKTVKSSAVVTLQKKSKEAHGIASPDKTSEKAVNQSPAEIKSNLTVVVTVQKANTPDNFSAALSPGLQEKSFRTHQDVGSPSAIKPCLISRLTYNHSSKQEVQMTAAQGSTDLILYTDDDGCSLSPENCNDEGPPPPPPPANKISLRRSKTRPRTRSKKEHLNKTNDSEIQIEDVYAITYENHGFEDSGDCNKTPVIVFLDGSMDIQAADKRLSTIFESEEDQIFLDEEGLRQEEEQQKLEMTGIAKTDPRPVFDNREQGKPDSHRKTDTNRKLKFKFSKNKLAQITQAIRTGKSKMEKKSLEIAVHEEEQKITSDIKRKRETKKYSKQIKRSEISSTKGQEVDANKVNTCNRDISSPRLFKSNSQDLCKTTFCDGVQESIKQLEVNVDSITSSLSSTSIRCSPPQSPDPSLDSSDKVQLQDNVKREREHSPSKRPACQILKDPNLPHSKRAKAQPPHAKTKISTKKQISSSSSSSSAQRSVPFQKFRHSSTSGSPKILPATSQQQTIQKQSSQANSRGTRAVGDTNDSATLPCSSKIPALCHSSGKHLYASLSTSLCFSPQLFDSLSESESSPHLF